MRAGSMALLWLSLAACVANPDEPQPPAVETEDDGKEDSVQDDPCVDGWCTDPGEDPDAPACEPRACDGLCGVVEDGCGGTISCGPCACQPRTCDDAAAVCGVIDDGCGTELECEVSPCSGSCVENQCVCDADGAEPNDTSSDAVDLGVLAEGENLDAERDDVTLDEMDDIDWYVVRVEDDWSWGNPHINVDVSGTEGYIVTIYYFCDYGPDSFHTCEGGVDYEDGFGIGCQSAGRSTLVTECEGMEETGTAYVAVEVGEAAVVCEPYTIGIDAT